MFNRLDLESRDIDDLTGLASLATHNLVLVNLKGNHIAHFHSFGTHPYMTLLDVRENRITSTFGLTKQPRLETVLLEGNPIAKYPLYRIMVLLCAGFSVVSIDGVAVSSEERKVARQLGSHAALAVACGWLLDLQPRSDAAYTEEAQKSKRDCITKLRKVSSRCTVASALSTLTVRQSGSATSESPPSSRVHVMERLSARVTALEAQVAQLEREKQMLQSTTQLRANHDSRQLSRKGAPRSSLAAHAAAQLAPLDVMTSSCVEFNQGVQATTNAYLSAPVVQACLRITSDTLTVLTLLERRTLAGVALNTGTQITVDYAKHLSVQDTSGTAVTLTFSSLLVLYCVYHSLSVRAFGTVKPLTLTNEELTTLEVEAAQRLNEVSSAQSPTRESDGDGSDAKNTAAEHSEGLLSSSTRMAEKSTLDNSSAPATLNGSDHDTADGARSQSATSSTAGADTSSEDRIDQLDFVADVPPLPLSPGHMPPSTPASLAARDAKSSRASVQQSSSSLVTPAPAAVSRFQNLLVDSTDTSTVASSRHTQPLVATVQPAPEPAMEETAPRTTDAEHNMEGAASPPSTTPSSGKSPSADTGVHATPTTTQETVMPAARRFQAFMIDSDSDSDG